MNLKNKIIKNLEMNGFPNKKVSLPLEKVYEVAENYGENLNTVLTEIQGMGINHQKLADKIIFESALPNLKDDGLKKAQELMGQMDPKELEKIQEQIANMSDEEKEKLMEQAKAMGLF